MEYNDNITIPFRADSISLISPIHNSDYHSSRRNARAASSRFLCAASRLEGGSLLGLTLTLSQTKDDQPAAFFIKGSAEAPAVTPGDYEWIFDGAAAATGYERCPFGEVKSVILGDIPKEYCYELCSAPCGDPGKGSLSEHCDMNAASDDVFRELFLLLSENDALVMLFAGNDPLSDSARGRLLVFLPEEMSLKLRSLFSIALPGSMIRKTGGSALRCMLTERLPDADSPLPGSSLYTFLCGTLRILQNGMAACDPGYTPLEELNLSVRAFNCLKRAGINSLEELRTLSDTQLWGIRNLGRRSFQEVKDILAEYETGEDRPCYDAADPDDDDFTPIGYDDDEAAEDIPPAEETDPCRELRELIGLEEVKRQAERVIALARLKADMRDSGEPAKGIVLNMEFSGNPGTAKTTVARIMAGIFYRAGLLDSPEPKEVGRADLIAGYVGQTAGKVREAFEAAEGRLLFIDEAYSLADYDRRGFGDEAISAIVQEMENRREKTIVIFAGYTDRMAELFDKNPGLRSRVPFHIQFRDYSAEELAGIAELEAEKHGFAIDEKAAGTLLELCSRPAGDPDGGNGRFSRNLVEAAILSYAGRLYGTEKAPSDKNRVITAEDLLSADIAVKGTKKARQIGFHSDLTAA